MSDTRLRNNLIKLAFDHHEYRKDILPLLKSGGFPAAEPHEAPMKEDVRLRAGLIRLAHAHPEFRAALIPIIAGCEKLPEGGMRDNCEAKKKEGSEVTDKQIRALRRESAEHGDLANSGMCAIALGEKPTKEEAAALKGLRSPTFTREKARRQAEAQIRETEAAARD